MVTEFLVGSLSNWEWSDIACEAGEPFQLPEEGIVEDEEFVKTKVGLHCPAICEVFGNLLCW
jgi:hypothetical protein